MWVNLMPCRDDSSWRSDWVPRNIPTGPEVSWSDIRQGAFIWFNFEVEIEWVVGGADLSWSGRGVPALDWALMLNWVPREIRETGQCTTRSSSIDFGYSFTRHEDHVTIEASYTSAVANAPLIELDELSITPTLEALQLIAKFHPEALQSRELRQTLSKVLDFAGSRA